MLDSLNCHCKSLSTLTERERERERWEEYVSRKESIGSAGGKRVRLYKRMKSLMESNINYADERQKRRQ